MTHLAYFPNDSSVEMVGNATLDGKLTHSVEYQNEQMNASQLLQLESLDLWEQRKSALQNYLELFKKVVNLFARERKVPCEYYGAMVMGTVVAIATVPAA